MAAAIHYEEAYPAMVPMDVDGMERLEDPLVEWRIVEHDHEVGGKDEVHAELEEYKLEVEEVDDKLDDGNMMEVLNTADRAVHMADSVDGVHRVKVGHNAVLHDYDGIHMNGGPLEANEII